VPQADPLPHAPEARARRSLQPDLVAEREADRLHEVQGRREEVLVGDIYKMRPDGTHRRAVLTSKLFEFRPDWGATR